jgi:hypothetical protein
VVRGESAQGGDVGGSGTESLSKLGAGKRSPRGRGRSGQPRQMLCEPPRGATAQVNGDLDDFAPGYRTDPHDRGCGVPVGRGPADLVPIGTSKPVVEHDTIYADDQDLTRYP